MQDEQEQAPYLVLSRLVSNSMERKKSAQERLIITIYSGKLQVCIGPSVHTAHSSPASLAQEHGSALGSSWALHQPAGAQEMCPACLTLALQPTTLQLDVQELF